MPNPSPHAAQEREVYRWFCLRCTKGGQITMPAHIDVWSGAQQISHRHYRKSPKCQAYMAQITVRKVPR